MWIIRCRSSSNAHRALRPSHALGLRIASLLLLLPSAAHATPELPTHFDARSLGMGGTGVSYTSTAAAAALNPAGLSQVEALSLTLVVAPFLPRPTAPFADGEPTEGNRSFVPLPFVGGAYRISDDLVLGAALYAASGAGASFDPIPELDDLSLDLTVAVMEAALPVSFEISERLSVGAALRFAFAFVEMDLPAQVAPALPAARIHTSLSGTGFPGVLVGARYQATDELSLGLAYRSKLTVDLEGDGDITADFFGGMQPVDAGTSWSIAHAFRAGADLRLEPVTLALDVTYTLLDDAIDSLPLRFVLQDGAEVEPEISLQWENSLAAFLGAEHAVTEYLALRVGYGLMQSGTPEEFADPRMPPPGLIQAFTVGGGYATSTMRLDLGAAYVFGGSDVEATPNGASGVYESDFFLLSASATYAPSGG